MNPPSALHGAMGRERKPFSYLPGGLDLSQIKSEKMAKRLMRNAMNEGVPERPVQSIHSPTTPTTPIPVPNFNCLPVQVFPTFQLPANPKSLLRTRSTPNQYRDPVLETNNQNIFANNMPSYNSEKEHNNNFRQMANNNRTESRPISLYSKMPENFQNNNSRNNFQAVRNNDSDVLFKPHYLETEYNNNILENDKSESISVSMNTTIPDKNTFRNCHETVRSVIFNPYEFTENNQNNDFNSNFQQNNSNTEYCNNIAENRSVSMPVPNHNDNEESRKSYEDARPVELTSSVQFPTYIQDESYDMENTVIEAAPVIPNIIVDNSNEQIKTLLPSEIIRIRAKSQERNTKPFVNGSLSKDSSKVNSTEILVFQDVINDSISELKSIDIGNIVPSINTAIQINSEENGNSQSEVNSTVTTKKQIKTESRTEENHKESQNGSQNVDTEAELTVQLPSKKSAAKTETKVEVVKKILPDGGVQEIKTTTTTTTIDGRTEIRTRTETKTIPKGAEEEVEEEEEEEYEEEEEESGAATDEQKNGSIVATDPSVVENGYNKTIVTKDERSETTTTKKVVVSSTTESNDAEVVEKEEDVEEEEQEIEEKVEPQPSNQNTAPEPVEDEEEEEEEVVEDEEEEMIEEEVEEKTQDVTSETEKQITSEETEKVDNEVEAQIEKESEIKTTADTVENKEVVEEEEEQYEEAEGEIKENEVKEETHCTLSQENVETQQTEEVSADQNVQSKNESVVEAEPAKEQQIPQEKPSPETKPASREIPILFDKVEDIEIKPIGPASEAISRTRTESTEIITSKDNLGGPISTQTELHRVENIVVQNRITKTLDKSYEQLTQQGLPTVKTYFVPPREPISISPQPSKPYQSSYTDPNERRHSLLLDRLSVDRQIPLAEQYQIYNNNSTETQNQYHEEPQSEVLTVSNVKPSMITNQQWYQQTKKENVIYNNLAGSTSPQFKQERPQYQAQAESPAQSQYQAPQQPTHQAPSVPQYQTPSQPQYPASPQPQYQYQSPSQPQFQPLYQSPNVPQYQSPQTPQYQQQAPLPSYNAHQQVTPSPRSYTDSYSSDYSKTTNTFQQNSYPSYTPAPNTWETSNDYSSQNTQSQNRYSFLNKESTDSYKQNNQQYSSSYVPPPWEQDSSTYVAETPQTYYQPPAQTNVTQNTTPSWKPPQPQSKFSKPPPTAYVPPAPNQSFVKPLSKADIPKIPGRKTYYSEYERRYISVPESTYVPGDSKYQPQPDPSPQYYYDNDEATEKEEHAWRKELREFTEKSSQTQYTTDSVRPPWEEEQAYPKTQTAAAAYTPTPTWSQTLRPRSGRERTFESDYGSQEWSKTNTIGRARPLSTYTQSNVTRKMERTRGVSVDRYNPNSYKSPIPMEHPPVQGHTLTPASAPPPKFHANPNVPAYHNSRASAEPREQPTQQQYQRPTGDRASPIQSRSFKYLQWITGTDE